MQSKKMKKIVRPKNREEWLKCRSFGIGSSEIPVILGLSPFETPYQLWRRKKNIDPPQAETLCMRAGHYLEDAVSRFFEDASGRTVIKSSQGDWLYVNPKNPIFRVSPDRIFWTDPSGKKNEHNKSILECKTTRMPIDKGDIPKHWFCQVQYLMGVSEHTSFASLAWLTGGNDFDFVDINFNRDFFSWEAEEAQRFWTDYIVGDKEPELINSTDVVLKYSRHTDRKIIEATADQFDAYLDLQNVKNSISELEKRQGELETLLKLAILDAEEMDYNGKCLAIWRAAKPSKKFDVSTFESEHPDLAASYYKEVDGSRRFLLKK